MIAHILPHLTNGLGTDAVDVVALGPAQCVADSGTAVAVYNDGTPAFETLNQTGNRRRWVKLQVYMDVRAHDPEFENMGSLPSRDGRQ